MADVSNTTLDALAVRLDTLEDKLDRLTQALDAVTRFSGRVGLLADAAGDTAAWAWNEAEARGIDPIERGQDAIQLAERLSDPEQMALVGKLLDRADLLHETLNALDSVDEGALRSLVAAAPDVVGFASPATEALVAVRSGGAAPVGPIGALLKLSDPDVQKAIGFSLAMAKALGQRL